MSRIIKGRIVDVSKINRESSSINIQGIKQSESWKYRNYKGGFGTYVTGYDSYEPKLKVKVYVFDLKKSFTCECYNEVLNLAGKTKMSQKMKEAVLAQEGLKISLELHEATNYDSFNKDKYVMKLKGSFIDEDKNVIIFDPSILVTNYI